jgi:hypothetical protein
VILGDILLSDLFVRLKKTGTFVGKERRFVGNEVIRLVGRSITSRLHLERTALSRRWLQYHDSALVLSAAVRD